MKHLFVTLLFLLFLAALSAQAGLFGLSYGDSYEKAKQTLAEDFYEYVEVEHSDTYSSFYSETNDYVDVIELYFDDTLDQLIFWRITYRELDDDNIISAVLDAAISVHGEDYELGEDVETYIWDLGGGKYLYLGYDADWLPVAEYYNSNYAEYSNFY